MRDSLVSYDAGAALAAALTRELEEVAWLEGNQVELRELTPSATLATDEAKKAKADVVLLVQADYRLGPAFTNLVVTARTTLVPAHGPLAPATIPASGVVPLYKNLLWTLVTLPDLPAGATREAAAERWARDGGSDARRAMDLAVADLSRMIAWDLQQAGTKGSGSGPKPGYAGAAGAQKGSVLGPYGTPAVPAFQVAEEGGRRWMRTAGGDLASCGDLAP